jgi:hypothetical protein
MRRGAPIVVTLFVLEQIMLVYELLPDPTDAGWAGAIWTIGLLTLYPAVGWVSNSWRGLLAAFVPLIVGLPRSVWHADQIDGSALALGLELVVLSAVPIAVGIAASRLVSRRNLRDARAER